MTDDKDIKKNVMKGFDMVFRHIPFVLRQPMEGCPSRDTAFALKAGPAEGAKEVQCPNLRACYQFFEYVRRNVPDEHRHIIDDGREKFTMYLGHSHRSKGQRDRIRQITDDLRSAPPGKRLHIVGDFKMKILPMQYRESTIQFYGKRYEMHVAPSLFCHSLLPIPPLRFDDIPTYQLN